MKRNLTLILLAVGFTAFLASCQCKTCKRSNDPSVQICKGDGTEDEYNNAIDYYVNFGGYDCK